MKNQSSQNQCNSIQNNYTFYCNYCNHVGDVIIQYWIKGSDAPFKIGFISHNKQLIAMLVGDINLNPKLEGDIIQYNYCSHCNQLIKSAFDHDYILVMNEKNRVMN
jgi:hypothetical protein